MKRPSRRSPYVTRSSRGYRFLFNAVEILWSVKSPLLNAPSEDFGSCDMAIGGPVLWPKVDIPKFQLHQVNIVVLQKT